jgi:hypothetical protein
MFILNRSMLTLTLGPNANYPQCHVHKTQLSSITTTYPARRSDESQETIKAARLAQTKSEGTAILSGAGLAGVEAGFTQIFKKSIISDIDVSECILDTIL